MNTPSQHTSDDECQESPGADIAPGDLAITPRTVIRGESLYTDNPKHQNESYYVKALSNKTTVLVAVPEPLPGVPGCAAITDWLNCSFPLADEPDTLNRFFKRFNDISEGVFYPVVERGRGLHGWRRSFTLGDTKALFAVGGQRSTAFLSLPGEACALIPLAGWTRLRTLLEGCYGARITRWDGAVDDYLGLNSVDWAVEQYEQSRFSTGGNTPSCSQHGNWLKPDGRGRTFEVGRRQNGKMLRIYEKGKQLGDVESPWVRWELELHNKDRDIPWDVLTNAGAYVAGSYQAMSWVSDESSRIKTYQNTAAISYEHLVKHAQRAYGPLINVMLGVEGDTDKIVTKLIGDGKPRRLELPVPPELKEHFNRTSSKDSG